MQSEWKTIDLISLWDRPVGENWLLLTNWLYITNSLKPELLAKLTLKHSFDESQSENRDFGHLLKSQSQIYSAFRFVTGFCLN